MINAVLTDIEGTTTSISFVHDVLFPFAYERMDDFLQAQHLSPAVAEQLAALALETGIDVADLPALADQLKTWIKQDLKHPVLKTLQGMMWKAGYESGDFTGHLYPEVKARLTAWKEQGIDLYVYSSGSVAAQKLLFGFSDKGDLTPLFSGYFDTAVGGKRETTSYQTILQTLNLPADQVLFLSDIDEELIAAQSAGMKVCQLVRDSADVADSQTAKNWPVAHNFDQIDLLSF